MPLLERARVEVYLPDLPATAAYYNLLEAFDQDSPTRLAAAQSFAGLMAATFLVQE